MGGISVDLPPVTIVRGNTTAQIASTSKRPRSDDAGLEPDDPTRPSKKSRRSKRSVKGKAVLRPGQSFCDGDMDDRYVYVLRYGRRILR